MKTSALALFAVTALATPVLAHPSPAGPDQTQVVQHQGGGHRHAPGHGHATEGGHGSAAGAGPHDHSALESQPTDTPATRAYREVNARMHKDMTMGFTNDVDVDFVRGMIPHHVGAVEMAKVALQHSTDPDIHRLAEEIIKAQEVEIAQMRAFLKRKGAE